MSSPAVLLTLEQWLADVWPRALQATLVALGTLIALRIARGWLAGALDRGRVDRGTRILVVRTASIAITVVGAVLLLGTIGVEPTALLTVVGAVGLALSLAIQDILKNFFSGIYLLVERPFRVGDLIRVKDLEGTVENIGVRTTALRTPENVQILVPNAIVFAEVVSNHTYARPVAAAAEAAPEAASDGPTAPRSAAATARRADGPPA